MDLNLFKNLENNVNTNENLEKFIKELNEFLAEEQNTKNETTEKSETMAENNQITEKNDLMAEKNQIAEECEPMAKKNQITEKSEPMLENDQINEQSETTIQNNIISETIVENVNKIEENPNRKEDHLYLVTEDRNGEVYLWDFTERAEKEFLEKDLPAEVQVFATEGAMLQYKNGKYILYSPDGFDIVDNAEE
ncbi:MAG: hypothetical protein IKF38_03040 [Clostridia bacterium]|nr:hypothetical protein [Clostridia bacterium]